MASLRGGAWFKVARALGCCPLERWGEFSLKNKIVSFLPPGFLSPRVMSSASMAAIRIPQGSQLLMARWGIGGSGMCVCVCYQTRN